MARGLNWERANQRDQIRGGGGSKVPTTRTTPERIPTHKQIGYIKRLAAELGIDPPFVATSRGATHAIRGLELRVARKRRLQKGSAPAVGPGR